MGDKILIDGGITNPLPLNRVSRIKGDLLVAVNVCGHDYAGQTQMQQYIEQRKLENSLLRQLLRKIFPNRHETPYNYYTLINRTASIMIHQNAKLSIRLTPPDILLDIAMKRHGGFDYDKSERLIAIGRRRMKRALDNYES